MHGGVGIFDFPFPDYLCLRLTCHDGAFATFALCTETARSKRFDEDRLVLPARKTAPT